MQVALITIPFLMSSTAGAADPIEGFRGRTRPVLAPLATLTMVGEVTTAMTMGASSGQLLDAPGLIDEDAVLLHGRLAGGEKVGVVHLELHGVLEIVGAASVDHQEDAQFVPASK